ncbi:MAG: hypothetical protein ACRC1Z_10285 [Waterburya sp.]
MQGTLALDKMYLINLRTAINNYLLENMSKSYIDIGKWWLRDGYGDRVSVNSVYQRIKGTKNEVGRYTLNKARNGELEKADISTLEALARICSEWAGEKVMVDDMIVRKPEKSEVNFRTPAQK